MNDTLKNIQNMIQTFCNENFNSSFDPDNPKIKLHMVGKLQTNKAKDAVSIFDTIECLDRYKLAEKLDYYEKEIDKKLEYYIQVNTGMEKQKGGVNIDECEDFLNKCRKNLDLNITGLMCIPPINEEPSLHFALINNLADKLKLKEKSMGMSSDYKVAIEFGSSQIRIGHFWAKGKNLKDCNLCLIINCLNKLKKLFFLKRNTTSSGCFKFSFAMYEYCASAIRYNWIIVVPNND